ncbi:TetR family transcriptional regulator [Paenibacillus sp. LC-T2]|uniref:TetR family transcriptional regulator n=1 Tax=Paenibacillus monticola TaxID=2666075 RepID=A0A7X2HA93_9BACL|nr:TetR/AcrR family transcriptional regulator [Paenibacillus monticola]MRN56310.1 TetR family transcriptional regulator [Paenibacillus monticola]
MFAKFLNLNTEKQDRILNAALKEFAKKGYQIASTNEIVKEAEISKGLLFHYFNNKKDLYLFLYDHFMEMLLEEIHAKIDWIENDIFIRYRQVAILKFGLFQKYPDAFDFIKAAYPEDADEVKVDLERRIKELLDKGYTDFFANLDYSKFKDGTNITKTMQIIFWTMEGFASQLQAKVATTPLDQMKLEEILAEMDSYSEILKNAFYK